MLSTIRYLVACSEVESDGGHITLRHIADTIFMPRSDFPCDIELYAVLGLRLERTAWNKTLDLLSWQVGEHEGERVALVHVKNALVLPSVEGFTSLSFLVTVPIGLCGTYGFDLVDRDGVFGVSDEPIATFEYGVDYLD